MRNTDFRKTIRVPIFNPRIMSGCSIGKDSIDIDALSFMTGLMCDEM